MSLQRQFNRHGTTLEALRAQQEKGLRAGAKRIKKIRPRDSYRGVDTPRDGFRGHWGILPPTKYIPVAERKHRYTPHYNGGKFVKPNRPARVIMQPMMTMAQLFGRLLSAAHELRSKKVK